jgi:hypothetical protein
VPFKYCAQLQRPYAYDAAPRPEAAAQALYCCMQLLVLSGQDCQVTLELYCQLSKRLYRSCNCSSSISDGWVLLWLVGAKGSLLLLLLLLSGEPCMLLF